MFKVYVIDGNQVRSQHDTADQATNAAIALGKQGRSVEVVQAIKSVAPNSGVTVTDSSGKVEVVK
jgi:hypothetical protein